MRMEHGHVRHGRKHSWGGRKRFFRRGQFKMALLELLASQPMHGYQLMKAMEEKTGGLYSPSPGSIYPNLQLLEETGMISSTEHEGKKLYELTEKGKDALRQHGQVFNDRSITQEGNHSSRGHAGNTERWRWRNLLMERPELIRLLAMAVETVSTNRNSQQAMELEQLLKDFEEKLEKQLDSQT